MKKNLVIGCVLFFCAVSAAAQNGSYFLTHLAPSEKTFDNVCFDMAQDQHGIMYFAMKAGVLEFDGREWDLIPGAGAVYGLTSNAAGEIFWVGARGFGKIAPDENGFKRIEFLSDSLTSNVFQTVSIEEDTYFLSENKLFHYRSGKPGAPMIVSGNGQNTFTGMFELFGVLYLQTERNTTFKVENNKLVYVNLNFSGNVLFQSRRDDAYLLGTSDNRVYICKKDLVVKQVPIKDQPYADANMVTTGAWVGRELLALGTLRGGVMLVNPLTGERDQIIDYDTGLPDNEVFSLMPDANGNIWVAHEYGFTQISPRLPFRSFSYYSGLKGNMLCASSHGGSVYVGTSLGLFKLHKDEVYDEVVTYVRVDAAPGADADATDEVRDAPSRRRGFFNFLRRNRSKDKADDEPQEPEEHETADAGFEKRVDKVLRSSQYVFKKVAGIDSKISHLVEVEGRLVAAGLEGVFEVNDLQAKPILRSPTRFICASQVQRRIMVSTYNDAVWSLRYDSSAWTQQHLISNLGDQIDYIFEGKNEWWLCGLDMVYQLQLGVGDIPRVQATELTNPDFDKTVGLYFNDKVFFVNNDGFFRFERKRNSLTRMDSLPRPYQYFALDGHLFYRDEHRWNMLGEAHPNNNLQYLNLFHDLRFIARDHDPRNLWLISGGNELLRFDGANVTPIQSRFPVFLKSVRNNAVKIADFSHIQIDQGNSAVTFEVVQPDYINPRGIEFRYFLDGMHREWSDWSSANNQINFPYLPPGEYTLRVQSRNIFGRISELNPLPFEVIPPYWKQSWFYALEFIVFASLVILSFRLSSRYHFISRLLSLITIILLIEFIQTVIGASIASDDSPVIEFFVQVIVALLILPVEGFLRNLMLRSMDSDSRFYKLIAAGHSPPKKRGRKAKVKETQ